MICEIPLTNGGVALIDEADRPLVTQYQWHRVTRAQTAYARRSWYGGGKTHIQYLHSLLLPVPCGFTVDHRDHDGLNCQRYNIREATVAQNSANQRKRGSRTKYKGVWPNVRGGKFAAVITVNYQRKCLGSYLTEEDAARAYDLAAINAFGEFAHLNFPGGSDAM